MRIFIEQPDCSLCDSDFVVRVLRILDHALIKTRGGGVVAGRAVVLIEPLDADEALAALAAAGFQARAESPALRQPFRVVRCS